MASTDSTPPSSTVNPSEVGWQFVPQYYTFVNKQPNRLHCFYTKASTVTHGVEGEDEKPCYGQQEIHDKIAAIGFQDCKVYIHSVDSQSSTNGGIIIQVIGEMSNRGESWRKFVQTFFLAEQAGGYFVLNDIFRFLKEDTVEEEEGYPEEEADLTAAAVPEPADSPAEAPVPLREPSPAPAPQPVEEPATVAPESPAPESPEPVPQTNGVHKMEPVAEPERAPTPPAEQPPSPSPAPPSPAPITAPPIETPAPQQAPAQPAAPLQPAQPTAPPAPKTWANLAATNLKKWGSNVAQESRGTSEAPPQPVVKTPSQSGGNRAQQQQQRTDVSAASVSNITTPQCFVKNVVESVTPVALTNTLTNRFGPVKDVEIVRNKACAFLEFVTLDAAKRAITASLPVERGGEGGIRIDGPDGGFVRITVETRKERGERPASRPRGGPPNGDGVRGAFRGRGGPGRGRGGSKQQ